MRNGITPRKKVFFLFLLPLLLIVASFWVKSLLPAAFILDGIILIAILIDLAISPGYKKDLKLDLEIPKGFAVHTENSCTLKIQNRNRFPLKFHFLLDLDVCFKRDYGKELIRVYPKDIYEHKFKLTGNRRGDFRVKNIFIKGVSLLGLLTFYRKFPMDLLIQVSPSLSFHSSSLKLVQKEIRRSEGSHKNRVFGDGTNFEMLRDYIKGDEYSRIDWKASARRKKPVTRIYRIENSLDISILLDSGRLMATEIEGMSMLDYAIHASLILSYAAAKNNDRVSLTVFGKDIIRSIPKTKDMKVVKKMKAALSDIQYDFYESDYQTAFSFLQSSLNKRSLIVIFSDMIDDSNSKIYYKHLSLIKKNHMVLLVLLRDKTIFELADQKIDSSKAIYLKAAAADMALRRSKTIAGLRKLGVEVLDLFPEKVSMAVIDSYFYFKRSW
jgi:uncharacterized protein (DUF58 family)